MTTVQLRIVQSGFAVIQDLGRPGYAAIGVSGNGAGDQQSARLANALVGNADDAPLVEITASGFEATAHGDLLVSVCGAAQDVEIDGFRWPVAQPLMVASGSRIRIAEPEVGVRSYLAVNGQLESPRALGSVAPDPLLGFGRRLVVGDNIDVTTAFRAADVFPMPVFRISVPVPRLTSPVTLRATPGPDIHRLAGGADALGATFEMLPQSDYIGVRLVGGDLGLAVRDEILSRGVPIGAVEVPPSGELIILMRGRLVTAGYPVVAVLTRASIDRLAQARPGDSVRLHLVDMDMAQADISAAETTHRAIAQRVAAAFDARGLGRLVAHRHASRHFDL
jgi:biotin-dependent carboxylase-like uncharacterized protein